MGKLKKENSMSETLTNKFYISDDFPFNINRIELDAFVIFTSINNIQMCISVVKEGDREYLYINSHAVVKITPLAGNCFYVEGEKR